MAANHQLPALRLCSYNLHGLNMGRPGLIDMCSISDVILVQEHWLSPERLYLMDSVSKDFMYFASSAMTEKLGNGVFRGRPFGGVGVFVRKSLAHNVVFIKASDRFIIVKIGDLYVVNVYFPDTSVPCRNELVADICSEIESYACVNSSSPIIVGGDFNCEFYDGISNCQDLNNFILDNYLSICDSKVTTDDKFTYHHESLNCMSWIDHFLVSWNLFDRVLDAQIIDNGTNLSDHRPIWIQLDGINLSVKYSVPIDTGKPSNVNTSRLRWDKADIISYYEMTRQFLDGIILSTDIDCDYDNILTALHNAARLCVPRGKASFFKHYWDDDLDDLKNRSVEANRLWAECGRPRSGYLYHEKRTAKAAYKRALRNKRRERDLSVSNDLHECLLSKDAEGFWKTWNCKLGNKSVLPGCVDGISDCHSVAQLFARNFEQACQPNSCTQFKHLRVQFVKQYSCYSTNSSNRVITVQLVDSCIKKLKTGKAAGIDSIEAEHLKFAHPQLTVLLCVLFNKMLTCGKVPELFCNGVTIPVPKNKYGDLTDSKNYRGITLSPVISKVFEMCLLALYREFLFSHDLQMGFKKNMSCSHSIFVMRKIIDHFVSNGSTINVCSMDVSKAFDKVNHAALFLKLMKRRVPLSFLNVLVDWYSRCITVVKWSGFVSGCFSQPCGVRQGGVLSPVLFAVYIDDLIHKLVDANLGCYMGGISIPCLLYADDIVLLSGSLQKLQIMLNICNTELTYLDLQFNALKCHVVRIGNNYGNMCQNVCIGNQPIVFNDSITYLGTLIKAGRIWRTDSSPRRRQCFRAFNSIYCKNQYLSEPAMHQLVESFCKPVLLYNLIAVNISKTECARIVNAWNVIMYKIYGVSGDTLNSVYVFTKCLPIRTELLIRQLTFLKSCAKMDNKIVQHVYDCAGLQELLKCTADLDMKDTDVFKLSSRAIRSVVFDNFVNSCS